MDEKKMHIKFYGTRGSIPAPLTAGDVRKKVEAAVRRALMEQPREEDIEGWINNLPFDIRGTFGGDTTCCVVRCADIIIVLDLGSGLRRFGKDVMKEMFATGGRRIYFAMSHVHWDHVQGFPFFGPIFISKVLLPKNDFRFMGGTEWNRTLEDVLKGQMDAPVFPMEWDKIVSEGPAMSFSSVYNGFQCQLEDVLDTVIIKTARLHHPNETYGWRIEYDGKVFVFASDTEPFIGGPDPVLVNLAKGADVLYLDGQYSEDQYLGKKEAGGVSRRGWGHGYDTWCGEVAKAADVKQLIIGHHDPDSSDAQIMRNVVETQATFTNTVGAYDGMEIVV